MAHPQYDKNKQIMKRNRERQTHRDHSGNENNPPRETADNDNNRPARESTADLNPVRARMPVLRAQRSIAPAPAVSLNISERMQETEDINSEQAQSAESANATPSDPRTEEHELRSTAPASAEYNTTVDSGADQSSAQEDAPPTSENQAERQSSTLR